MSAKEAKAKSDTKRPRITAEQKAVAACAKEIEKVLKKHGFAMKAAPRLTAEIELFRHQE